MLGGVVQNFRGVEGTWSLSSLRKLGSRRIKGFAQSPQSRAEPWLLGHVPAPNSSPSWICHHSLRPSTFTSDQRETAKTRIPN
jgi:hypothetical protein